MMQKEKIESILKKVRPFKVFAILTILWALVLNPRQVYSAANMSNLLESPKDRTSDPTAPSYKNQSFVFGGILNDPSGLLGDQVYVALGDGGVAVFNYDTNSTSKPYGWADRTISIEWIGQEVPISPVGVSGVDKDGDGHLEYLFAISGPYCLAFSVNGTGAITFKDRVVLKDPNNQSVTYEGQSVEAFSSGSNDYVIIGARQLSGTGGILFAIKFDETSGQWARYGGEPDFDVFQLAYPAYSIEHFSAKIKGSSQTDYLAVTGPNILDVFTLAPSNIGGDDSQDAISYSLGKSFSATGQSISTYTNSAIHDYSNPDANETLIFVGTDSGIYAFELDSEDNSTLDLREFGNISSDIGTLNVKGIYAANVTAAFRNDWLLAACGEKGIYIFKTSGNATLKTDTLALQYIANLDTSGEAYEIMGIKGASSTDITKIFVADGGGGIKVLKGSNLNDDTSRSLDLIYQWDESVAPIDVKAVKDYVVVLDQSGGISTYTIGDSNNAPVPMVERKSDGGMLGIDLAWTSRRTKYGTGSNLAGEPRALYVDGNVTDANLFVAAGSGGIKYLKLGSVNATSATIDYPVNGTAFKTDGEALGIDGYKTTSGFVLGVADGDAGVMFLTYDSSKNEFAKKSKVHINGTAHDIYLLQNIGSDSYAVVAYGTAGLVILKITSNSGNNADYLSNPELVATVDLGGSVSKVEVVQQTINGSTKYMAYCLVFDPNDPSVRKIVPVDITNPSAAAVVTDGTNPVSYPGNNSLNPSPAGIVDFTAISGNDRYYLVVASTERKTGSVGASQVFTVNITNPSEMLYSNALAVTYEARSVAVTESGTDNIILVGELGGQLSDTGYRGLLGRMLVQISQASNITVNVSASPRTVEPQGTSLLTATPGGGSQPYFYQWTVIDKSGSTASSIDNATSASPTWTAPDVAGIYNVSVKVTDRDGNTGIGTATIQVQPLGLSISDRIVKPGGFVRVPIHVTGVAADIDAFGIVATYDTTNFSYYGIEGTSDTAGWTFSVNENPAGTLRIGGQANGNSAISSGASADLAYLIFTASPIASTCTSVTISLSNGVDDIAGVNLTPGTVNIVVPGDLDGSCSLSPQDALSAFLYYLGLTDLRDDEAKVADVDNDGMVTPNDAILILDTYVSGS